MPLPYNKNHKERARELRSNMTEAERALWSKLRRKQLDQVVATIHDVARQRLGPARAS